MDQRPPFFPVGSRLTDALDDIIEGLEIVRNGIDDLQDVLWNSERMPDFVAKTTDSETPQNEGTSPTGEK
jgi:hypothetical protein